MPLRQYQTSIYLALPLRLSGNSASHWARRPLVFSASCWACWSALVLLFLQRHATKSLLHLSDAHSRLLFISVGVAFVVMPLDELPFASSLMLSFTSFVHLRWLVLLFLRRQATNGLLRLFWCFLKAFVHLCWCPFCCDPLDERPIASLLTLTHQDNGPRFGLRQSVWFKWLQIPLIP